MMNHTHFESIDVNWAILAVTEAKLDETFLFALFLMDGFSKPYRLDRNKNGGGIMIFII